MKKYQLRYFAVLFTTLMLSFMSVAPAFAASGSTYYVPYGLIGKSLHLNTMFLKSVDSDPNTNESTMDFMPVRTIISTIRGFNVSAKTVDVQIVGAFRTMNATQAMVLLLGTNGVVAQGTLADLTLGQEAHLYPLRDRDENGRQQLVMIVQFVKRTIVYTSPTAPVVNATLPTVQFNSSTANGAETASGVDIPYSMSKASNVDVLVSYTVAGTASGFGVDYSLQSGQFTIPAGRTTGVLHIDVVDDQVAELNETVIVRFTGANNAYISGSNNLFTYTINGSGIELPTVTFESGTSYAAESSGLTPLTVRLSKPLSQEVRVKFYASSNDATNNVDYYMSGGEITIMAGSTSATLSLQIIDDANAESDEEVSVTLYDPTFARLGDIMTHTHTIQDND